MNVLAIDPGADSCACVTFEHDRVVCAEFALPPAWDPVGPSIVVVERMQADERTRHVDVRHVLACQWNAALCAGYLAGRTGAAVQWYTPTEWKGSEPKPMQHARLFGVNADLTGEPAVLSVEEQRVLGGGATALAIAAAVEKGALKRWHIAGADCYPKPRAGVSYAACDPRVVHNLLDAAALGCVHLGRLEKR